MTRKVLIFGLIVLAAFLPLAVVPLAAVVGEEPLVFTACAVTYVAADAPPVALLALTFFRAPPSR